MPLTDRYSFANALYDYAQKNGGKSPSSKEGLYPEFVMEGVEYVAQRNTTAIRGFPVTTVQCTRKAQPPGGRLSPRAEEVAAATADLLACHFGAGFYPGSPEAPSP